jgi:hypothetical protein
MNPKSALLGLCSLRRNYIAEALTDAIGSKLKFGAYTGPVSIARNTV